MALPSRGCGWFARGSESVLCWSNTSLADMEVHCPNPSSRKSLLAGCGERHEQTAHSCRILLCLPELWRAASSLSAPSTETGGRRKPSQPSPSNTGHLWWAPLAGAPSGVGQGLLGLAEHWSSSFSFAWSSFILYPVQALIPNPSQHLFWGNPICNNPPIFSAWNT